VTVRITLEQCITLYRARIDAGPLVNRGKLDGAVAAPFQTFDDQDLFPTLIGKAARLAYGIAEAQAFQDGNKRLAWLVTVVFLELNGVVLDVDQDEAAYALRAVGARQLSQTEFIRWMICCSTSRSPACPRIA
jgi:hypothetical protein